MLCADFRINRDIRMIDPAILLAVREALRVNEIGDASPYRLSYARYGQSGASFGVFQGDTHVDPAAQKALYDALVVAKVDPTTVARILSAVSQACPNGSRLSDADEQLANAALSSPDGMAIVDKMDDHTLNVILAGLQNALDAAAAAHFQVAADAQLCIVLWVNMTGAPNSLDAWLQGSPTNGAYPPPGPTVTRADIMRYLAVSKYFNLHPRNLRHFEEAVSAGVRLLPTAPAPSTTPSGVTPATQTSPSNDGFVAKLLEVAQAEWHFFGEQTYDANGHVLVGGHKEGEEGFYQRIGSYWAEGTNTFGIDGSNHDQWPWSAAFISWIMKKAGAGDRFRYSTQHSVYIYQSIRDHQNGRAEAGFGGWRLNERKPAVGDLICWSRQSGIDYDHQANGSYFGHTDLIFAVKDGFVEVIGGNVGDSVTRRPIPLAEQGFLSPINNGEQLFALMENRIS
jgi:hypothetical protein